MASLSTPDSPASEDGSTRHFCKWIGCERVYDTVGQLGKHILEVHVSRVSAADPTSGRCHWANCPREQKPFSTKMKLIMHLRSHTGEKPYLCSFVGCTKRFSRMDILTKHMRSHAHHNPFACEVAGCTRRFPDEASLQQHLQSHPWIPQASTLNTLLGRRLAPTMNSEPVMADNQVVSLPTLQIRPPSPLPIQLLPPLSVSTTKHSTMEWSSRPSLSAHSHRPQGFGHISGDTTPMAMSAPPSPPLPSLPFHFVKTIDSSRTGDIDNHAKRMRTSRSETDLPSNWSGAASSTFPFKASSFKASPTQPSSSSHPFSVLSLAVPSSHMPIRRPVTSFSTSNTEVIVPIPQSISTPSGLSSLAGGSNTRYERKPMSIQSFSSSTSAASSPLSSDLPTPSRQNIKQDDLELLYFFAEHSSQPKGSSISMSVNSVLCDNDDNDASYNKKAASTKTLRQSRSEPTLPTYQFPTQPLHPQPAW